MHMRLISEECQNQDIPVIFPHYFKLNITVVSNEDSTSREDYLSSILVLVNDLLGVLLQNDITDAATTNPAHYIIIVMVYQ